MRFARLILAAFPIWISGCSSPLATVGSAFSRVSGAEKKEGSLNGVLDVEIHLQVQNKGISDIYFHPCSVVLQRREVGGAWSDVWGAACTLIATDPLADALEIAPGVTRETTIRVVAYPSEFRWPSTGLNGEYRIRALLTDVQMRKLPVQMGTTNEFSLPQN